MIIPPNKKNKKLLKLRTKCVRAGSPSSLFSCKRYIEKSPKVEMRLVFIFTMRQKQSQLVTFTRERDIYISIQGIYIMELLSRRSCVKKKSDYETGGGIIARAGSSSPFCGTRQPLPTIAVSLYIVKMFAELRKIPLIHPPTTKVQLVQFSEHR